MDFIFSIMIIIVIRFGISMPNVRVQDQKNKRSISEVKLWNCSMRIAMMRNDNCIIWAPIHKWFNALCRHKLWILNWMVFRCYYILVFFYCYYNNMVYLVWLAVHCSHNVNVTIHCILNLVDGIVLNWKEWKRSSVFVIFTWMNFHKL